MALAPLLYNITFDSQTRILYFWDKAGHEIYHCEIPSPAPALPTVSMSGDFGDDNWLFCDNSGRNQQVSPDNTIYVHPWSGSASWDNTKSYAVLLWATYQDSQGHGNWGFSVEKGSNNNNFYARNISSGTLYLYCLRVAVCSSSDAIVVTVYDSSNTPYNAFKYTLNGTDYYYVLDGTQTDWTDDLASIGYHVPPLRLPTVSDMDDFLSQGTVHNANWVNLVNGQSAAITMPANDIKTAYVNSTVFDYDDTKSYGIIQWQTTAGTLAGRVEVSVVNNSGLVAVKNVSSSSISILQARIAICSSPDATVITVYDSSNNPYNAFKYTLNGTDYYYVLDGAQTDWTDDLASIGYHVPPLRLPTVSDMDDKLHNL